MIPVFKPSMTDLEINAVTEVLKSGWLGLGPKVKEFEDAFRAHVGCHSVVGLNSGTAALDMALRLIGVGHGDEVIVPTNTFVSTAHAVVYNMATPIFADCHYSTLNIMPESIRLKITPRTRAIVVVHHGGRPVDMRAIEAIAMEHGLYIIEDCAHGVGSYYRDYMGLAEGAIPPLRHVGSKHIGCFSFHAVKNLAMGEGGAITLPTDDLTNRAKKLRWLGIDKGTWDRTSLDKSYWWEYNVDEIGYKSHLNDIHAAIGLAQLSRVSYLNECRREIADMYRYGLSNVQQVFTPSTAGEDISSNHLFCIQAQNRDELSVHLKDAGINTGVHYKPIHLYNCYGNQPVLPRAEDAFKNSITLPMFPDLTDDEVKHIINSIRGFYGINDL